MVRDLRFVHDSGMDALRGRLELPGYGGSIRAYMSPGGNDDGSFCFSLDFPAALGLLKSGGEEIRYKGPGQWTRVAYRGGGWYDLDRDCMDPTPEMVSDFEAIRDFVLGS